MSSYYNIDELNASMQNTFIILAGLLFQKFSNLEKSFSSHLFVPVMGSLVPLYIWYSMTSYRGNFPDWPTCLEQLSSTAAKLVFLFLAVKRFPDSEEHIALSFLLVTHGGMLCPELYAHDRSYHIHLRFAEDTLLLNMVSQFCHLRALQKADALNSNEIERSRCQPSGAHQDTHDR